MDECVGSVQNEKMVALVPKAREEKSAVSPPVCVYVSLYVCVSSPRSIESREDIVRGQKVHCLLLGLQQITFRQTQTHAHTHTKAASQDNSSLKVQMPTYLSCTNKMRNLKCALTNV